eukprot:6623205-Pyramimonas_sp.AAC.4
MEQVGTILSLLLLTNLTLFTYTSASHQDNLAAMMPSANGMARGNTSLCILFYTHTTPKFRQIRDGDTDPFRCGVTSQGLAYFAPVVVILCPLDVFYKRSRYFFVNTVIRCMFPFQVCNNRAIHSTIRRPSVFEAGVSLTVQPKPMT